MKVMNIDQWVSQYFPKVNPNGTGIELGGQSVQFNPHDEQDVAVIRAASQNCIWSLYDGEEDEDDEDAEAVMILTNGYGSGAVGYLITEVPFAAGESIEVKLD